MILTMNMERVLTQIDTNKRNVFHDGSPNESLSSASYWEGGSDHLIKYPTLSLFFKQAYVVALMPIQSGPCDRRLIHFMK